MEYQSGRVQPIELIWSGNPVQQKSLEERHGDAEDLFSRHLMHRFNPPKTSSVYGCLTYRVR